MEKRGKKGISPLIATVLLIGFVVAVAAVVMLWGKGFVKERAEKEGALSQAQLECNLIEIEIEEVSEVYKVTNIGSRTIDGFIIRTGSGVIKKPSLLEVGNSITEIDSYTLRKGDEIIPCVKPEGAGAPLVPCSDKAKKLRE